MTLIRDIENLKNSRKLVAELEYDILTKLAAADAIVSEPPAPPVVTTPAPVQGWPNKPADYTVSIDQPFDALPPLNARDASGWGLQWVHDNAASIVEQDDAPHSPRKVLQVKYRQGWQGGQAPATVVRSLQNFRNVYVGIVWKANANWQLHNSNVNKIAFVTPVGGGEIYLSAHGAPLTNPLFPPALPELRVQLQMASDGRTLKANRSPIPVIFGQWHRIEWLLSMDTRTIRAWLGGVLVIEYTDVVFPSGGFAEYKQSPTWGGVNDSKTHDDYFWYDHVHLAGK